MALVSILKSLPERREPMAVKRVTEGDLTEFPFTKAQYLLYTFRSSKR